MLTKISVVKTYWLGMTKEQKDMLLRTMTVTINNSEFKAVIDSVLMPEEKEVLEDLRQSLLNV